MKDLPEVLYHAAPECVYDSIEDQGLKSNFTEVYAASSVAEALSFMYFRIMDHPHSQLVDGKVQTEMVSHNEIHIWMIDTDVTDRENWEIGSDHSASFFGGANSYVHRGDITPDALMGCEIVTRAEIEEALASKSQQKAKNFSKKLA